MAKKVIKLTETDLQLIVKKVIKEQQIVPNAPMTIASAISNYPMAKKRTFKVLKVNGRPSINKNGKDLLLTNGMTILPTDNLKFKSGDEIVMASVSPEDKGRYFQQVALSVNPNGKLEIFVYSD